MYEFYKLLNVQRNASFAEIRAAYKSLCMTLHPDRGGSEEEFKKINEAYSVLIDPERRKEYDKFGTLNANNKDNQLKGMLTNLIITLMESESIDVIADAEKIIISNISGKEQQIIGLLDRKEKLEKKIKRFKRNEKTEFLITVIEGRIEEIMKGVNNIRSNVEVDKKLLIALKDFEYENNVSQTSNSNYTAYYTTGTSSI